jgi:hypothetical protein
VNSSVRTALTETSGGEGAVSNAATDMSVSKPFPTPTISFLRVKIIQNNKKINKNLLKYFDVNSNLSPFL